MIYTKTGAGIYSYFTSLKIQGCLTTDPNQKYSLPDGTLYNTVDGVEDWIIKMAEQIKSERQKIIMNKKH